MVREVNRETLIFHFTVIMQSSDTPEDMYYEFQGSETEVVRRETILFYSSPSPCSTISCRDVRLATPKTERISSRSVWRRPIPFHPVMYDFSLLTLTSNRASLTLIAGVFLSLITLIVEPVGPEVQPLG